MHKASLKSTADFREEKPLKADSGFHGARRVRRITLCRGSINARSFFDQPGGRVEGLAAFADLKIEPRFAKSGCIAHGSQRIAR